MSKFTGNEGRFVSLSQSKKWVENFRSENPDHTHAFYFGCDVFNALLDEPGCVGIRVYYAQDDNGDPKMVLIGVDENGNNISKKTNKVPKELRLSQNRPDDLSASGPVFGKSPGGDDDEDSGAADQGKPCPPFCGGVGFP